MIALPMLTETSTEYEMSEEERVSLRDYVDGQFEEMRTRLAEMNAAREEIRRSMGGYVSRDSHNALAEEYRREHAAIQKSMGDKIDHLRETVEDQLGTLKTWQVAQEALSKERDKSTTIKLAMIALLLSGLGIALKFIHF